MDLESRRRRYEQLAQQYCGEYVAIHFDADLKDYFGDPLLGYARWSGHGYYEIGIRANMPLGEEARVVAHEVAHVLLKHPSKMAPDEAQHMVQQLIADAKSAGVWELFEKMRKDEPRDKDEEPANDMGKLLLGCWRYSRMIDW